MANMESTAWQLQCEDMKQRGSHLLKSGLWSDCTFSVRDQTIEAHRLILAMASPVFAVMFYGSLPHTDAILIEDVEPDTFKSLLEYIYTDTLSACSFDVAYGLYYAAQKYMLPCLVKECSASLTAHLSPRDACRTYELAALFDDSLLMDKCMKVISENTKEILNDSSFVEIEPTTVLKVFSLEDMDIESELELVTALTRYIEERTVGISTSQREGSTSESSSTTTTRTALDTRDQFIRDALGKIRFLTLTLQQFTENPSLLSLLTAHEYQAVLMNITSSKSYISMPDGFSLFLQPRNTAKRVGKKPATPSIGGVYCSREYTPTPGIRYTKPQCSLNFKVDQPVTLLGVQVPTRVMETSEGTDTYQENIQVNLRDSRWSLIDCVNFSASVCYNNLVDIKLSRAVILRRRWEYWIIIKFNAEGHYPRGECTRTTIDRDGDSAIVNFERTNVHSADDLLRSFIIQKPNTRS